MATVNENSVNEGVVVNTESENFTFAYDDRDVCLVEYLPELLRPIYDFKALSNSAGIELSELYKKVRTILEDQFINTASIDVIAKWERYLNLTPNATDTLEERRFRILAKLGNKPPYTDKYLENRLNELCGVDHWRIFRDYNTYSLTVQLSADSESNTETVASLLQTLIPANLTLTVENYRTRHSELTRFTHAELRAYTHDAIKYAELVS